MNVSQAAYPRNYIVYEVDEVQISESERIMSTYLETKSYNDRDLLKSDMEKLSNFFDERDISVTVKEGDELALLTSKALITFAEFKKIYM